MNAAQDTPHGLLIFSIGPVQDFIATARRTQDLWMGSYILAYLSYEAMKTIQSAVNYDPLQPDDSKDPILFPVLDDHPFPKGKARPDERSKLRQLTLASLPNKFTVRIETVEEGEKFARKAQQRVYDAWLEIAKSVQAKIPGTLGVDLQWDAVWNKQIDPEKWLEVYWVIYPNPDQQHDFGQLNALAERALQARKGVRNFAPVTELGERDSLSGRRAALGSTPTKPRKLLRRQWQELGEALYREGVKKKGKSDYSGLSAALSTEGHEYLSAVEMTKRFAQRFCFDPHWGLEGKFPSTSSIASAVFRQKLLENDDLRPARERFIAELRRIGGTDGQKLPETLAKNSLPLLEEKYGGDPLLEFDGELFYPDTYTEKRLKDDFNVPFTETAAAQLKQNVLDLRAAAAKANIALPPTYYALILMDGDKMGDHLAKIADVAGQRDVSRRLMRFALQKVQAIVEDKYLGRVVYAGGDDLLAFLPLENVLKAAHEVNEAYRQTLDETYKNRSGQNGIRFSASAGVVIAHHLAPLDRVLQAARDAEKLAKERYGRNSIVFSILKRSGEQLDVGAHWDFGQEHPVLPTIEKVYDLLQNDKVELSPKKVELSPKFAFDAEQEAAALTNMPQAHEKRLALLLKRHTKKMAAADQSALAADLAHIGAGIQAQFDKKGRGLTDDDLADTSSGTVEVARWLLLARFFVAAMGGEE